ncbi:MAG TPA: response regulator transcription factor [Anaerolineales bacterium]|nr:response regulator transcription factor [Anaerolineales bacterium]
MQKHILVVDDDELMRRSVAFNLEQAGYQASNAGSAEDALSMIRRKTPDLILLDIGLPGMDGLDALRQFREQVSAPVIFVTARRRELDEILGLELGADDYITKPFEMSVLLAHVKAVLRRTSAPAAAIAQEETVVAGDLTLDPLAHTVTLAGQPLELTRREFDLLHALVLRAGQVLSTQDLLTEVWGAEYVGEPQVVYVHIRWLREKIEDKPEKPGRILTVRGVGYKLIPRES